MIAVQQARLRQALSPSVRTTPRRVLFAGCLVALALSLSGCLDSGYTFISHRNPDKTNLYFKVPSKWTMFSPTQIIEATNGHLTRSQINQMLGNSWSTTFSASPTASPKSRQPFGDKYPAGVVFGQELNANERDSFSYASLRAVILGTDPLSGGSQYNVLSYSEFTEPGGIHGSKLQVDITESNQVVTTFSQVAVVDANTDWVYAIGLGCRASCWGPNQGLLNQILNSWNVKAQ